MSVKYTDLQCLPVLEQFSKYIYLNEEQLFSES